MQGMSSLQQEKIRRVQAEKKARAHRDDTKLIVVLLVLFAALGLGFYIQHAYSEYQTRERYHQIMENR